VAAATNAVIRPVVPPATPFQNADRRAGTTSGARHFRGPLPLPDVPKPRTNAKVYGLAALDCRGRIADQAVLRALGWSPGTRLDIREIRGLLVIHTHAHGVSHVTSQGHLRLPAPVRRWCGFVTGDRVLLAADPTQGRLVVHPPTALDAMITRCHARLLDGDPA
jgi:hypothetical protein